MLFDWTLNVSTLFAIGLVVVALVGWMWKLDLRVKTATAGALRSGDIAGALRERVVSVETKLGQLPTKDAMHSLEMTIAGLSGDLRASAERFDALRGWAKRLDRVTERIETFLLDKGADKP